MGLRFAAASAALLFSVACELGAQSRPAQGEFVFARPEKCEGYCQPIAWRICAATPIHVAPGSRSRVTGHLRTDDVVDHLEGVRGVIQEGLVVFADTFAYPGATDEFVGFTHFESPLLDTTTFFPSDTLVILDYDDEGDVGGAWRVRRGRELVGVWKFWEGRGDSGIARLVRPSVTELWVRIRANDGRAGWIKNIGSNIWGSSYYDSRDPCGE
jgi:hypothetical protein